MSTAGLTVAPLPGASFGGLIDLRGFDRLEDAVAAFEAEPDWLPDAVYASNGLAVLPRLREIREQPELLLRLSRLFGPEVENYHHTLTERTAVHAEVAEILLVSNLPPTNRRPPARPEPPLTADGRFPTRFPHRRGWHTDQSFRRPPPDFALFYAAIAAPRDQGQTLYADAAGAYDALPDDLRERAEHLVGLHVNPGTGRSEYAVRAGETPRELRPHERPQRQPVVRTHPVTGRRALYLCEAGQMDWIEGPFVDMEPGPDGDGARLLYELMAHITDPRFTYTHEWNDGDLVIYDNRCTLHAATWFDADRHQRLMWRTTVMGNPGPEYAGERRSWIPLDDAPEARP